MKWQTLDLRYAENLVSFPEFYLIGSLLIKWIKMLWITCVIQEFQFGFPMY